MSTAVVTALRVVPRVNLLPPEFEQQIRVRRAQATMGATVAVAIIGVLTAYAAAVSSTRSAEAEQARAESRVAALQRQVAGQQEVRRVFSAVTAREATLGTALSTEVQWSRYLGDLSAGLPAGVWLSSLAITQTPTIPAAPGSAAAPGSPVVGTVSVEGTAMSYGDVASWLEASSRQSGTTDGYLTTSTTKQQGGRDVVAFSSTARVTDAALSRRYASPGRG